MTYRPPPPSSERTNRRLAEALANGNPLQALDDATACLDECLSHLIAATHDNPRAGTHAAESYRRAHLWHTVFTTHWPTLNAQLTELLGPQEPNP